MLWNLFLSFFVFIAGVIGLAAILSGRFIPFLAVGIAAYFLITWMNPWHMPSIPTAADLPSFTFLHSAQEGLFAMIAFLLSAFVFWPIVFVGLAVLLWMEREIWGTVAFAACIVLYWFVAGMSLSTIDWAHVAWVACGYLVLGFLFTFAKLWFHSKNTAKEFFAHAERMFKDNPNVSKSLIAKSWDHYGLITVKHLEDQSRWDFGFKTGKMVECVILWTAYWPAYGAIILFEDFIREVAEWIVAHFGGVYKTIINKAFAHVESMGSTS